MASDVIYDYHYPIERFYANREGQMCFKAMFSHCLCYLFQGKDTVRTGHANSKIILFLQN